MSEIEKKIMSLLKGSENEMQVEEMASELNLTRHTVSKYLAVLKAKKLVTYKTVGRTKLWKKFSIGAKVKPLTKDDISDILRIEERIEDELGIKNKERIEYLEETAIYNIEHGDPMLSIGAEVDGNLVGFMIGELRLWEFGRGEKTGWIRILGVDPEFRGRGIGRKLAETLLEHFKRRGIKRVRTMVDWYAGELISYFRSLGFDMMNMVPLEKEL